jgi:hypothetical protein
MVNTVSIPTPDIQLFFSNLIDSPIKLIVGTCLILLIVFNDTITFKYKRFASSIIGRIIAPFIILLTVRHFGWVYGILIALAYLLTINGVPEGEDAIQTQEGFVELIKKKAIGHRWYVERILGERPQRIETEKVETMAIQDDNKRHT